jgi:hypothetical protein
MRHTTGTHDVVKIRLYRGVSGVPLIGACQCPLTVTRSPTCAFCGTSFLAEMLLKLSAVVVFASFTKYCLRGIG